MVGGEVREESLSGPGGHGHKLFGLVSGDLGVDDLGEEPVGEGLGLGEGRALRQGGAEHGDGLGPGHSH